MLTQEEWVRSCLSKYRWEPLPTDQKWEAAHFPLPECLGGQETVLLWSADHTVQGLLQSVELDHKCFHHLRDKTDTFCLMVHYPEYLELFAQLKSRFNCRQAKKTNATNKANSTGYFDPQKRLAGGITQGRQNSLSGHMARIAQLHPERNKIRGCCIYCKKETTRPALGRYHKDC